MRISSVRAGDIVCVNKRGRVFHAKVVGIEAGGAVVVSPIERNISYRHIQASEISEHWMRAPSPRRARAPKNHSTLELPLAP